MTNHNSKSTHKLWLTLGIAAGVAGGLMLWRQKSKQSQAPELLKGREQPSSALITGASSGIGAAYARRLARANYNLILVARREERLKALAEELEQAYTIKADVLTADLSNPEDIEKVVQRIHETKHLAILINNAGFGTSGNFAKSDPEQQNSMIRVHALAPARLTRAALPVMLSQNYGAIVNVSSIAAFVPMPNSVNYCATKAYLATFSEALHQELLETGVRVQALCPGFTRTEFQDHADIDDKRIPGFMWMTPEAVVAHSLQDLQRDRVISVPGLLYQALIPLTRIIPRPWLRFSGSLFQAARMQKQTASFSSGFHKRTYGSVDEFLNDLRAMMQNRDNIRHAMQALDPAFRERLMLTVTQVNGCRYCAQQHAKMALAGGLSEEEIALLLDGVVEHCPPDELVAILYAQHWADTAGQPDSEARHKLVETYGPDTAAAIEAALGMIKIGNYAGNTFDYVLYRLSGGRMGT